MKSSSFGNIWLVYADIKAMKGYNFIDLIDIEHHEAQAYIGAYANILTKANTIGEALNIVAPGLAELNFEVVFIDKIENFGSLVEYGEVNEDIIEEAKWLVNSEYVFKISDKLFSYVTLDD